MDHLPLTSAASLPPLQGGDGGNVVDVYKKALATAATATAYAVLARSLARELLPDELCAAARWGAAFVRTWLGRGERERHTLVIRCQYDTGYGENHLFDAARAYVATRIDPRTMRRLCLARSRVEDPDPDAGCSSSSTNCNVQLHMEPGGTTKDVFEGVEFTWTSVEAESEGKKKGGGNSNSGAPRESLELSFDAEHTGVALDQYVPFVLSTGEDIMRRDRALRIFMNKDRSWHDIAYHHPATFDTLAMDPELKQSIIADLDRFLKRREYYRRIGKAWKRGYLLYGPPGTGKSSMVAAMTNYLRFNIYDLDLSQVRSNSVLQCLLTDMSNKSILVIEDIDCCFDPAAASREDGKVADAMDDPDYTSGSSDEGLAPRASLPKGITLSGLLNFIDGLWSTCGDERIIVFTTNYKDRLDPALLRPGRMDRHVYMGYCGWEAFKTLAWNYFLVDEHQMFKEIQELLAKVDVTPAEVSEMLLRSEDVDVALVVLAEFLQHKKQRKRKEAEMTKQRKREKQGAGQIKIQRTSRT
jgi:chaperone BCS1